MSRHHAAAALLVALSFGATAQGAEQAQAAKIIPPEGWEEPTPLAKPEDIAANAKNAKSAKKKPTPACCKFDSTCCSRQIAIETLTPLQSFRSFTVKLGDLPVATVKEAKNGEPPFSGVPNPKITDDGGRPFPWPDRPKGSLIHVVPPGRYGFIKLASDWFSPYFEQKEYRGMGAGAVRTIQDEVNDRGVSLLYVPIELFSVAQPEPEVITFDEVRGKLEGSPEVKATYWMHANCKDIAAGLAYACKTPYEGEERATFVMPEVLLGFESKDAKHLGGFFRNRFANNVPLTFYYLPVGPGRSGLINATLSQFQSNRWFPLPKQKEKLPEEFTVVISTSQTSVEAEARIHVFFTKT